MEWNRTVDRAVVRDVSEAEVLELKKTEITDKVKESIELNGSKPELFRDILRAAVELLERLIAKAMQKVMDIAEKAVHKAAGAVTETPKKKENHAHSKNDPAVSQELFYRVIEKLWNMMNGEFEQLELYFILLSFSLIGEVHKVFGKS